MWSFLIDHASSVFHYLLTFGANTLSLIAVIAAIAFYIYALIDVRIPKIIVTPVCCILIAFAVYVYATTDATNKANQQCDIRFTEAQQRADAKQLTAALDIKTKTEALNSTLNELATVKAENKQALADALAHPDVEEPAIPTKQATPIPQIPPPHTPIVKQVTQIVTTTAPVFEVQPTMDATDVLNEPAKPTSCLSNYVPANVVRALQGSASDKRSN